MSRHELSIHPDRSDATRAAVGWDRPLATFYAQIFRRDEGEADETAFLWIGTYPGELKTAADALAIVAPYAVIPTGLSAELETDRLKTLGARDGPAQAVAKRTIFKP